MSEKINFRAMEGDTNVKTDEGETALRKTNMIDMDEAEIAKTGEANWDDFEMLGASEKGEREYVAPPEEGTDLEAILKRAKASHVGRKILSLNSMLKMA